MKKSNFFLIATSAILLGASAYLGYNVIDLKNQIKVLAKIPASPPAPICPVSYNYADGDSEGIINYETAQALANNYNKDKNNRLLTVSNDKDTGVTLVEDSKSVWFSLDRLKKFLWHIEKQNCENSCQDTLGLRIYFGKYPDLNNLTDKNLLGLEDVPKEYSNHHTLFMVPTYRNKDGYDYDFYPGGEGCRTPINKSPLMERKDFGETIVTFHAPTPYIVRLDGMGTSSNAQNHGNLIPPNDPTGTSFR
jgi:hypothetical protein